MDDMGDGEKWGAWKNKQNKRYIVFNLWLLLIPFEVLFFKNIKIVTSLQSKQTDFYYQNTF